MGPAAGVRRRHLGSARHGAFFLNASSGVLPTPFVRALQSLGYRPIPPPGRPDQMAVDIGIQRPIDAIGERSGDVTMVTSCLTSPRSCGRATAGSASSAPLSSSTPASRRWPTRAWSCSV